MSNYDVWRMELCNRTVEELQLVEADQNHLSLNGFPGFAFPGGFNAGDLIVISAESGAGKSLFALTIFADIISKGVPAAFITLESEETTVLKSLISLQTGISAHRLSRGILNSSEITTAVEMLGRIRDDRNLCIQTAREFDSEHLADLVRDLVHWHEAKAIIADGLMLITDGAGTISWREVIESAALSLKRVALRLGIPIIVTLPQSQVATITDIADSIIELNTDMGSSLSTIDDFSKLAIHPAEVVIRKNRYGHAPAFQLMSFDFDLKRIRSL